MALLTTFGGLAASVRAVTKSVRFVAAQMVFSSHSEETPPALSGSGSVSWRMKNSCENLLQRFFGIPNIPKLVFRRRICPGR
jgi:hypothetical protein